MPIPLRAFVETLTGHGIAFFTGVPDSLLAPFCAAIAAPDAPWAHRAAASEGGAIALAAGHHLASGRPAAVYMQNSGLGNAINPLTSLADPMVYGFPLVLIVGWRGEVRDGKQLQDEPQHVRQGLVTPALLDVLAIPHIVLGPEAANALAAVGALVDRAVSEMRPVAIVVRKSTFKDDAAEPAAASAAGLGREDAIAILAQAIGPDVPIVATTGKISRELFEVRQRANTDGALDFLTVGSMGHASQIAAGLAMARPERPVVCFDGDGAILMHLSGLTVSAACANLRHVVLNNRVHDSVGGQPTAAPAAALAEIARACGYGWAARAATRAELDAALPAFLAAPSSSFLEVIVRPGARADLGRPDRSPKAAKEAFMARLTMEPHER
jgi:phosphonopyruvate decarboxylase